MKLGMTLGVPFFIGDSLVQHCWTYFWTVQGWMFVPNFLFTFLQTACAQRCLLLYFWMLFFIWHLFAQFCWACIDVLQIFNFCKWRRSDFKIAQLNHLRWVSINWIKRMIHFYFFHSSILHLIIQKICCPHDHQEVIFRASGAATNSFAALSTQGTLFGGIWGG